MRIIIQDNLGHNADHKRAEEIDLQSEAGRLAFLTWVEEIGGEVLAMECRASRGEFDLKAHNAAHPVEAEIELAGVLC